MKIYSWNVNGIRAVLRKNSIIPFIKSHNPDVLCIQETKAQPEQVEINLPEYYIYWNSAERKGYSGTAILSKIEPLAVIYGIPADIKNKYTLNDVYGDMTTEGRVLTLEFDNYFISTVYTPNAKSDLSRIPMRQQWDPAFLEYMVKLEKQKPVIFCGDLNVAHTEDDLARPEQNEGNKGFTKEERSGFDKIIDSGFIDTFRHSHIGNGYYTWWSHWGDSRARNVGWRIDYFFTQNNLLPLIKKSSIHPDVLGSDHCPISIDIDI